MNNFEKNIDDNFWLKLILAILYTQNNSFIKAF